MSVRMKKQRYQFSHIKSARILCQKYDDNSIYKYYTVMK